jgi:hypothetical protein
MSRLCSIPTPNVGQFSDGLLAEIVPRSSGAQAQLARIYWFQGNGPEALAAERREAVFRDSEILLRERAEVEEVYARSGFRAACLKSAQMKERGIANSPARAGARIYPMLFSLQYACLQDREKVFKFLDSQVRPGNYGRAMLLKTAPELDFIRSDPRYQALIRAMGLPQ